MSKYLGDYAAGCSIADTFTTVTTTGAPTALTGTAGSVCIICYKLLPGDATGMTCSTAGITLAVTCLGITGLNGYAVNTNSDLTFYACGHDFALILQGGTVGGTCVSGYTVATFSLEHRAALRPLIHGRTVDVDASGRVLTQPCSTVFSVTSVLNDVPGVTSKTGYSLSAAGVNCIAFAAVAEPSNVFGWPGTLGTILGWLGALASNKIVQEAGQQGVCNRAASSTIATADTTDDGTSATRGSFT